MRWALGSALAFGLGAAPALAGCFTPQEPPRRVVYDQGITLEYLGVDGDVLTYRSGEVTTRMQAGLWPLSQEVQGRTTEYVWDGPLPDLAQIAAQGGKAEVRGQMQRPDGTAVPVMARIEVLGHSTRDWEDCRYDLVEYRKGMTVDGKALPESVHLYAPAAMVAFRSQVMDAAGGAATVYSLSELH